MIFCFVDFPVDTVLFLSCLLKYLFSKTSKKSFQTLFAQNQERSSSLFR